MAKNNMDSENLKSAFLNLLEDQQMTIAKLRESEKFNRLLFEKSPIGISINRLDGAFVDANKALIKMLGYDLSELRKLNYKGVSPEGFDESDNEQMKNLKENGSYGPYERKIITAGGDTITVKVSGVLINQNDEDLILSNVEDITKQKKDEQLLLERERTFRSLYENDNIGFYRTTPDGRILLANPTLIKMLGYDSFEDFSNRNLEEDGYEPNYRRVDFKKLVEEKGTLRGWEDVWYKKDGTELFIRESSKSVKDEFGVTLYYEGTVEDISDSKKTAKELKIREEIYRSIFATIGDAIFITEIETGMIIECNEQIFGFKASELIGRTTVDAGLWIEKEGRNKIVDAINRSGSVYDYESDFRKKDGSVFTGSISVTLINLNEKKYLLSVIRDITERKKAEQNILQSEQKFRTAFYTSPDSVNINRLSDGLYVSVNNGFTQLTGYTEEEVVGRTSAEISIWADAESRSKLIEGLSKSGQVNNLEARFRMKDGSIKYGLMSASIIQLEGVNHILNITRDITERKEAEKLQWELKEELHTTLYSIGDAVISTDKSGLIRQINPIAEGLTGWKEEEAKGKYLDEVFNIICEDNGNKVESPVSRVLNEGVVVGLANHTILISKDGSRRPIADSGAPIRDKDGNITGVVLVFRDQTEERASQESLLRSEERMRAIIEGTPNLFFYTQDENANTTYVSSTVEKITGYPVELWLMEKGWFLTDSIINENAKLLTHRHLNGDFTENSMVLEVKHASGSKILLEVFEYPVYKNGKVCGLQGVAHDVTARKLYEENLKKLFKATEQSPVSIVITDVKGTIEYVNPYLLEITGFSYDEVIGKNPRIFSSGNKTSEEYKELWNTILDGKLWKGQFRNRKKDGTYYWESASISAIKDDLNRITHFIAVKEDITDRKMILEQLMDAKNKAEEANKTKDLFLANMSHELRTPLIGILGYSDLLSEILKDEELVEMSKGIKRSGKRLLNTLNMILNFTKIESEKYQIVLKRLDVKDELETIEKMFRGAAIDKHIEMVLQCPDGMYINSDPSFFAVILENLVNNAIKFTERGSVSIEAGKEGNNVFIRIKDTGIGIDKDNLGIIFEEFRQVSEGINREFQGTGLGLSIAKKYTELLNGSISVESEIGIGTIFTLRFQAAE